jgi:hypothetical protein
MQVTMIGLDLAKNVFQVHGVDRTNARCCASGCHARRFLSSSRNFLPAASGWRLVRARIGGRGNCSNSATGGRAGDLQGSVRDSHPALLRDLHPALDRRYEADAAATRPPLPPGETCHEAVVRIDGDGQLSESRSAPRNRQPALDPIKLRAMTPSPLARLPPR